MTISRAEVQDEEPQFLVSLDCSHSQILPSSRLAKPVRRENAYTRAPICQTLLFRPFYRRNAYITLKREHQELGVKEHDFGVWGGYKSARRAHRNSKAKSAFFDGGTQTRKY